MKKSYSKSNAVNTPRVFMLMWEIPPLIAGGTWTACYHLARNLHQRGANFKVIAPWANLLDPLDAFGKQVDASYLGITPPARREPENGGETRLPQYHPYPFSPYYSHPDSSRRTGDSDGIGEYQPSSENIMDRLVQDYKRRFLRFCETHDFDIVHAHDWVTFPAAIAASERLNKPWVAHFHSTEFDRRSNNPSPFIAAIEREAATRADRLVCVGKKTAQTIREKHHVSNIEVIPNVLSEEETRVVDTGNFDAKRVVFLGRLTSQKGPDLFAKMAGAVKSRRSDIQFEVFGSGEDESLIRLYPVRINGGLEWSRRSTAFKGASAVVVPSRSEPFGMVILEAMLHRVPVLYTKDAGAADFLGAGIPIRNDAINKNAQILLKLLDDQNYWRTIVDEQTRAVKAFISSGHEKKVIRLWESMGR